MTSTSPADVLTPPGRESDPNLNLPNVLSAARLAMAVGVFLLIGLNRHAEALALFVVASLTDYLDGYLARRWRQTTALGRQLDTFADKILVLGTLIFLVAIPESGYAPWMVTVTVIRDLLIQTVRSYLEGNNVPFGAKKSGKLKATFQYLAIAASLYGLHLLPALTPFWRWTRDVLIWVALALTIHSAIVYLGAAWAHYRGPKPSA